MESVSNMTVEMCLSFCGSNTFAGLEYTKECWCSPYLSSIAALLLDSDCNLACEGNSSEICGGSLRLSVYNQSSSTKGEGGKALEPRSITRTSLLALVVGIAGWIWLL